MKGMKKFRKALALLLALVMSLSITMVPSFADSSVADKPEGLKFTSFVGDADGAITFTEYGTVQGMVDPTPLYVVKVPEGTTKVTVSYPESALRFSGSQTVLMRYTDGSFKGMNMLEPEIAEGIASVELNVADWMDADGKAVACQDPSTYEGIEAFTFEYYTPAEEPAGINLKVTAGTEETLKAGDELTAVLTAPAPADPFAACNVQMDFNKDILEAEEISATGITATSVTEPANANEAGKAAVVYAGANNITQTEDIVLTVKFVIKEGVYEDDYKDLITVNKEETYFTNADDDDLTVIFDEDAISYDAHIAGKYKVVIPDGATFDEVWTDADTEDDVAHITITDTGRTIKNSSNNQSAKLFKITVPKDVHKVYFKWYKSDPPYVMFGIGSGWDYPQQWGTSPGTIQDRFQNDEYAQFGVDPASALDEDDKSYKLWGAPSCSLVCLTFEVACDHSDVEHADATVTCTEDGMMEYWHCKDCGRYYSDEALTHKVKEADLEVPALGHNYGEDGKCTRCGVYGDVSVKFTGDNADKVTDKSSDTENAGQEYKFKAEKSKVYQVSNVIVDKPTAIDSSTYEPSSVALIENGFINVEGKSIVNYDLYSKKSNSNIYFNPTEMDEESFHYNYYDISDWVYCYVVLNSDGEEISEFDGWGNYFGVSYAEEDQYYVYLGYFVGKNWSSWDQEFESYELKSKVPVFALNVKKGAAVPEETRTLMTEDDEGFYTIPAKDMKALTTVNISVDMYPDEKVKALIDAIGEVTLEKEEAIVAAREAFDALSDEDKVLVGDKYEQKLVNAEQKLEVLKLQKENADQATAITDLENQNAEQAAALEQANTLIASLTEELNTLKGSSQADEQTIAELEEQLEALQDAAAALAESTATKEQLTEEINTLNGTIATLNETITGLQNELNNKETAETALNNAKKAAVDDINGYVESNLANIYDADKYDVEIAALKGILAVKDAEKEDDIKPAVDKVKAVVDEKVNIKTDTEAAKALKVTGLKAKAKSKKFTVSWKKNAEAEAYQVQYKLSSAKKFSNLKKSVTKVSVKSKKLKKGKKYIFQVRTIKTVNGKKVYGAWVKTKAVKCK